MIIDIVDCRYDDTDEIGFNGFDGVCIGIGEDFQDSLKDAISLVSDLTSTPESDIMRIIESQNQEALKDRNWPSECIDAVPDNIFYSVGLRYKC